MHAQYTHHHHHVTQSSHSIKHACAVHCETPPPTRTVCNSSMATAKHVGVHTSFKARAARPVARNVLEDAERAWYQHRHNIPRSTHLGTCFPFIPSKALQGHHDIVSAGADHQNKMLQHVLSLQDGCITGPMNAGQVTWQPPAATLTPPHPHQANTVMTAAVAAGTPALPPAAHYHLDCWIAKSPLLFATSQSSLTAAVNGGLWCFWPCLQHTSQSLAAAQLAPVPPSSSAACTGLYCT
jgi:hypothetical protein